MSSKTQEVAVTETAEIVENAPVEFGNAVGVAFDDLASESITLPGHDLVKDEDLDALVGVDLIITRVTYREGLPRLESDMWLKQYPEHVNSAYASLELVTNTHLVLNKINRVRNSCKMSPLSSLDALGFDPGDAFVVNDGSTGIYRQITAFLAMTGYITVPDGKTEGESGQTILDTIPEEWSDIHVGNSKFNENGFLTYTANVRLRCKRGVRVSKYPSRFNPDSQTRYLA